jgi:hypothetical protein
MDGLLFCGRRVLFNYIFDLYRMGSLATKRGKQSSD